MRIGDEEKVTCAFEPSFFHADERIVVARKNRIHSPSPPRPACDNAELALRTPQFVANPFGAASQILTSWPKEKLVETQVPKFFCHNGTSVRAANHDEASHVWRRGAGEKVARHQSSHGMADEMDFRVRGQLSHTFADLLGQLGDGVAAGGIAPIIGDKSGAAKPPRHQPHVERAAANAVKNHDAFVKRLGHLQSSVCARSSWGQEM